MAFTSLSFIAFITAFVLLGSLLKTPALRGWFFLLANLVFIGSYVDSVLQLLPLALFLLLGYVGVEVSRRRQNGTALFFLVALVVLAFVFLKKFSFLGESMVLPFPYLIIGLSYVLFRILHLMVDAGQGELAARLPALQFFNYTCNFLTFIAGPIQRYQDFAQHAQQPAVLDEDRVYAAVARVVKGFVKVGVVSAIFKYLFDSASGKLLAPELVATGPQAWAMFIAAAVFYTVYLYANFSGYMDIVIGVGELVGLRLPENFNKPFLARNFLDFWARWHITLSDWFRTYVFNPLLTVLAMRFTSPKVGPYLGVVAFFITFLIMGVWHGTTSVFVIYGLLMGAGASVNKLWQVLLVKRLGKKRYKAVAEKTLCIYASRGLTLAYFATALTCLWVDMDQLKIVWSRVGASGLLVVYVALTALAGLAFYAQDKAASLMRAPGPRLASQSGGAVARNLWLAFQILSIMTVSSFFHKAPEFVYRAF